MISADHDRSLDLALLHQPVEASAQLGALAVFQPADPGRKSLEGHLLLGLPDPAGERRLVRKGLQHRSVSYCDIGGVAGECHPAERTRSPAEERPNVLRNK